MARLPTPPVPVMPPSGTAPVIQEVGVGAGEDAMSPAVMIQKYLLARGFEPTPANVRLALEANAREGAISGLRSDTAGVDPTGGGGVRRGGPAVATPPPTAGTSGTFGPGQSPIEGGPTSGGGPAPLPSTMPIESSGLAQAILGGLGLAGLAGVGGYNAYRQGGQPDPSVPVRPVDPGAIPAEQDIANRSFRGGQEVDYTQLGNASPRAGETSAPPTTSAAPSTEPSVDLSRVFAEAKGQPTSPMTDAINRAVEPNFTEPRYTGSMPPVDPAAVGNYKPGPGSRTSQAAEDAIRSGKIPPPRVPFPGGRVAPTDVLPPRITPRGLNLRP